MPPAKHNVYIVGFMASGKTEMGRLLAKRLGWEFLDTDSMVVKTARTTIARIFERRGEKYFRTLEVGAVAKAARGRGRVVSVGGGAVLDARNVKLMRKTGVVMHRETPFGVLFKRLGGPRAARPLWKGDKSDLQKLYRTRRAHYKTAAHVVLKTGECTVEQAAMKAHKRLLKDNWITHE